MIKNRKHFQLGSGVFTCVSCGVRTRLVSDGGDSNVCEDCYELAGLENGTSDTGTTEGYLAEALERYQRIVRKGGKYAFWTKLGQAVHDANPTPATAPAVRHIKKAPRRRGIDKSTVVRGDQYDKLNAEGRALNENNDCAVIAIAAATGLPYVQVHAALAAEGRKPRRGTHIFRSKSALKALGFEAIPVPAAEFIKRYPGGHANARFVTSHHPQRFHKVWADGHSYVMRNRGHMWSVLNGVNHDWCAGRCLRVQDIYRIVRVAS